MPKRRSIGTPHRRDLSNAPRDELTATTARKWYTVLSRLIHRRIGELTRRRDRGTASATELDELTTLAEIDREWINETAR